MNKLAKIAAILGFAMMPVMADAQVTVSTLAGNGNAGLVNGAGANAQFDDPFDLTLDGQGNLYVADPGNHRIRKVKPSGVVSTFSGNGADADTDGAASQAAFALPYLIEAIPGGGFYVWDYHTQTLRHMTAQGAVSFVAGPGAAGFGNGQGYQNGNGGNVRFFNSLGLATDSAGNAYVSDTVNMAIRKVTPAGAVTTFAGVLPNVFPQGGHVDALGTAARFGSPRGIAADAAGNIYVADVLNYDIRKISPAGNVTTYAGSGTSGSADGPALLAQFQMPGDVAVDASGNIYVLDGNRVRMITATGNVVTLAGSSTSGFADGNGANARFNAPQYLTALPSGRAIYVSDTGNQRIRMIRPEAGVLKVCKVAGGGVPIGSLFSFTIAAPGDPARTVSVPAGPAPGGYCKSVRDYPVGNLVAVTEQPSSLYGLSGVSAAPTAALVAQNLTTRSVQAKIAQGVTELTFVNGIYSGTGRDKSLSATGNRPSGYMEVCKTGAAAGTFTFTVSGVTGTVSVPAGACSGPIAVVPGTVTVTEVQIPATAEWASGACCTTFPASRQISHDDALHTTKVTVIAGDISSQTIVYVANRPRLIVNHGDGRTK